MRVAQLANHVAAAGAGLEDRAFDLDRTAERRGDPARVHREVLVPIQAFKATRRDVARKDCRRQCGSWTSCLVPQHVEINCGLLGRRSGETGAGLVEPQQTGQNGHQATCSRPIRRNLSREPDSASITIDTSVSATIRRSPTSRATPVRSTRLRKGGKR